MASLTSTFATLRALHLVIADALDDIQRVFAQNGFQDPPASPTFQTSSPVYPSSPVFAPAMSPFPATPPSSVPPTPLSATFPSSPHSDGGVPFVDYPSPDLPFVSDSPSELLALHPDAVAAATRIVAACGQLSNIVHKPFLSLCDAIMSYNLPACMRLVEHLHVAEVLREAEENRQCSLGAGECSGNNFDSNVEASGPVLGTPTCVPSTLPGLDSKSCSRVHPDVEGLHVAEITKVICSYAGTDYIDSNDLTHVLRLLSTHHIFRETAPDTFALNRIASLLDSGKNVKDVFSDPDAKYDDAGGTPAFVALTTDELFKSAAYLTEAFTGVQLPVLGSNPSFPAHTVLPMTTAIPPETGYAVNDLVACPPTTRSSSILTHIAYPEDKDAHKDTPTPSCSLPPTYSLENARLDSPAAAVLTPCQSSATKLSEFLPPLIPFESPPRLERRTCYGNGAQPEKLLAFNLAFRTQAPYFEWLENGGEDPLRGTGQGASMRTQSVPTPMMNIVHDDVQSEIPSNGVTCMPRKSHRLQRFSNAMNGSIAWEAPKAILSGFDWYSLPKGSTIVDVGGGIGSTTMVLVRALNDPKFGSIKKQGNNPNEGPPSIPATARQHKSRLPSDPSLIASDEARNDIASKNGSDIRFVVQDRPVVTALGIEAWGSKCPEMLENGQVVFKNQDFFEPQSPLEPPHITRYPSVYLLRVVLHDWPDEAARRILINLRVASNPDTRLVIAEHVLPLACVDEDLDHTNIEAREGRSSSEQWTLSSVLANIQGAERTLVAPPLLSNLGKASANAYWMDLIMHISLNGKERTLREFCALTLSAGWRITRMTRPEGLLFAYLVCEPIMLPDDAQEIYNAVVLSSELSTMVDVPSDEPMRQPGQVDPSRLKRLPPRPMSLLPSPILERSTSRCGTPTFGSRMMLPRDEELQSTRSRGGAPRKWFKSKGLGMRSVVMQKAEKQREGQNLAGGPIARDNSDVQSVAPASSSHVRVWWKKTPPGSTGNSTTAVHEIVSEVSEQRRVTGRKRRDTLKSSDSPSTPSPRISLVHQKWPSAESTALLAPEASPPASRTRRPSVASITRKLSFVTFGRRPSVPDTPEPLPTPPPSATLTELAPPPTLRGDTARRRIKHLPSLPTLVRDEVSVSTTAVQPIIPRRPSLSFLGEVPASQTVSSTSGLPCRPGPTDSPKLGILKSRANTSKQSSLDVATLGSNADSTPMLRRQRRVTLSNSLASTASSRTPGQGPLSGQPPPPLPVGSVTGFERVSSMPKLPRRLSIPILRRKQSQPTVRDAEKAN